MATQLHTLKLSLDWDSTLFELKANQWQRVEETTLPISTGLKSDLTDLYKHYSELYFLDNDDDPVTDLDRRLLDDKGLKIWLQLREELNGTHQIFYDSVEFMEQFENPEAFGARRRTLE